MTGQHEIVSFAQGIFLINGGRLVLMSMIIVMCMTVFMVMDSGDGGGQSWEP